MSKPDGSAICFYNFLNKIEGSISDLDALGYVALSMVTLSIILETQDNVCGEDAENIHDRLSFAIQKLLKYFEVSSDLSIAATVLDPRLKLKLTEKLIDY